MPLLIARNLITTNLNFIFFGVNVFGSEFSTVGETTKNATCFQDVLLIMPLTACSETELHMISTCE
jgi:hypothetical protein